MSKIMCPGKVPPQQNYITGERGSSLHQPPPPYLVKATPLPKSQRPKKVHGWKPKSILFSLGKYVAYGYNPIGISHSPMGKGNGQQERERKRVEKEKGKE
ncbi:MAG: hypothetical protein II453_10840 [Alphaproteobacteria bacterium]|nr:hypothetical protein [Alphaproteobacteria bacterium]